MSARMRFTAKPAVSATAITATMTAIGRRSGGANQPHGQRPRRAGMLPVGDVTSPRATA